MCRIAGRRGAERAERGGATGFLSTVVRGPLPGSSPVRPPGPRVVRTRARPRRARQRASSTGHRPRSSRRCSMKAGICAPSARCTVILAAEPAGDESGAISAVMPCYCQASSWWPRAPTDLVLGHHPVRGPKRWTSLNTSMSCSHLQPLRIVAGWLRSGERRARRDAWGIEETVSSKDEPQGSPCIRTAARRDQQVHRPTPTSEVTRSLSRPQATTTPSPRRKFKTAEVSTPDSLAASKTLPPPSPSAAVLPLVQHRAPPCRDRDASPAMMSIITDLHRNVLAQGADVPCKPPGAASPRTLRPRHPANPPRFPKPSGSTHPPLPQQEKRVETVGVSKSLTGSDGMVCRAVPAPAGDTGRGAGGDDVLARIRRQPERPGITCKEARRLLGFSSRTPVAPRVPVHARWGRGRGRMQSASRTGRTRRTRVEEGSAAMRLNSN